MNQTQSPQPPQPPLPPLPPQQPYSPQAPYGQAQPMQSEDPGKTLGIVSLVTALLGLGLVGLITGIIGRNKSKQAGYSNGLALAGIIISAIGMIVGLIVAGVMIAVMVIGFSAIHEKCKELGPGRHEVGSAVYTCGPDGDSYSSTNGQ